MSFEKLNLNGNGHHRRLRVAWFSCVDAETTLSGYTSKQLLPLLKKDMDVEVFSDSDLESTGSSHYLTAFRSHKQNPFDIFFYQVESSPKARFLRVCCGLFPGITWMHQACFSDLGPEPVLNSSATDTVQLFSNPSMSWPSRKKDYKRKGPYADREIALSFYPLFSHSRDISIYLDRSDRTLGETLGIEQNARFLPIPAELSDQINQKDSRILGKGEKIRVLYAGSPTVEFRPHKLLEACRRLGEKNVELRWLCPKGEQRFAEDYVERFSLSPETAEVRELSVDNWKANLAWTSMVALPVFSHYSHQSPYLEIALAAGKPCMVLRHGSTEELPDGVVLPVEPGPHEAEQFWLYMERQHSGELPIYFSEARNYAREHYASEVVAQELYSLFKRLAPKLAQSNANWREFQRRAQLEVLREVETLATTGFPQSILQQEVLSPTWKNYGWSH